jgi:DNA-directed RNA polymerase specialized sigma24 family protein
MWDKVISAIVYPRLRAADYLAVGADELCAVGQLAALEAERTWRPEGGRSRSSWVWFKVEKAIQTALARAGRDLASDTADWGADDDFEPALEIRAALSYLQARLDPLDYRLLWLFHAEGWSAREISGQEGLAYGTIRNRLSQARNYAMTILAAA